MVIWWFDYVMESWRPSFLGPTPTKIWIWPFGVGASYALPPCTTYDIWIYDNIISYDMIWYIPSFLNSPTPIHAYNLFPFPYSDYKSKSSFLISFSLIPIMWSASRLWSCDPPPCCLRANLTFFWIYQIISTIR
jgi:hypothetical protein